MLSVTVGDTLFARVATFKKRHDFTWRRITVTSVHVSHFDVIDQNKEPASFGFDGWEIPPTGADDMEKSHLHQNAFYLDRIDQPDDTENINLDVEEFKKILARLTDLDVSNMPTEALRHLTSNIHRIVQEAI